MKVLYQFVGGKYDNTFMEKGAVEKISNGERSRDYSKLRAAGILVPRAELDNQPLVDGYLSPMYDGLRYEVDGVLKSEWQCTEEEKQGEEIHILRYETTEIYNKLSH